MHAMPAHFTPLGADLGVYSLIGTESSHLIVRNGRSLLIDCHSRHLGRWARAHELPLPEVILHTHVQPEHCREGRQFPGALILVHEALLELATNSPHYQETCRTVWTDRERWPVSLGEEEYGFAGSQTAFPPGEPLERVETFRPDRPVVWQDIVFEPISLPSQGGNHCGFLLHSGGVLRAVFSGDLLCHPARLVNLYDLEINYSGPRLESLPVLLRQLAELPAKTYFPATGPVISDGPAEAIALAEAIETYHEALAWESGKFQPPPILEGDMVGRFKRLAEGVFQMANAGNCIVFIDEQGQALLVDPGPCDYESPDREERFLSDLQALEQQAGLISVDTVLITHIHGDHYDLLDTVRDRYPGVRVGTLDLVARVMEAPWDYPYPALLPWYQSRFESVAVDFVLEEGESFHWHNVPTQAVHLPGHCYCHAAFLLTFANRKVAVTGDSLQSFGSSFSIGGASLANHSVPDQLSGFAKACRMVLRYQPDLLVGGHGSHCAPCIGMLEESLARVEVATESLRALVRGGDLQAACLRPGFPVWPREMDAGSCH